MNCKRIQDFILTDYTDGRLSGLPLREVENHLMACLPCRLLAQDVRNDINDAFKLSTKHKADDFVWTRIKSKIRDNEAIEGLSVRNVDILAAFLNMFKPYAMAFGFVLMLGLTFLVKQNLAQHDPYLTYIMASDSQGSDEVSNGIERYFL